MHTFQPGSTQSKSWLHSWAEGLEEAANPAHWPLTVTDHSHEGANCAVGEIGCYLKLQGPTTILQANLHASCRHNKYPDKWARSQYVLPIFTYGGVFHCLLGWWDCICVHVYLNRNLYLGNRRPATTLVMEYLTDFWITDKLATLCNVKWCSLYATPPCSWNIKRARNWFDLLVGVTRCQFFPCLVCSGGRPWQFTCQSFFSTASYFLSCGTRV